MWAQGVYRKSGIPGNTKNSERKSGPSIFLRVIFAAAVITSKKTEKIVLVTRFRFAGAASGPRESFSALKRPVIQSESLGLVNVALRLKKTFRAA